MLRSVPGLLILLLLVRHCHQIDFIPEPTLAPQVAACYEAYPDQGFVPGVTGIVISSEPITVVGCPTPGCSLNALSAGFQMWDLQPGDSFVITGGPYCGFGSRHWGIESTDGERYGWIPEFLSNDDGERTYQIAVQE